jgi:molecular chaperone DnaK
LTRRQVVPRHITLTASSGLSDSRWRKCAGTPKAHAAEDRKRKELIESRNHADNTAYAAEKALKEFGDKVPSEVKSEIEAKVAEVKRVAEGEDVAAMKAATEVLGEAIQKIGATVYEQNPPAGGGTEAGSSSKDDGPEVVDGEVKE